MTATTVIAPVIGIAHIGHHQVQVQVRTGGRTAWLTLLGRSDFESFTVGTISGLGSDAPQLRVFQRMNQWATPTVRHMLVSAVTRLYLDYRSTRQVEA